MYRQCTTEKTATQQKMFLESLYQAMQEQLYSNISITDLCTQTGLSRNIFYRLFTCKDDALFALIDNYFFECFKHLYHDTPRENLLAFYTYWREKKELLDILEKNRLESFLSIRGTFCCHQINYKLLLNTENDFYNSNVEVDAFYTSGFIGLLFYWYHCNFSRNIEEMTDITLQLLQTPVLIKE